MWERLLASMRHWCRLVGRASPGARAIERDGVTAAVVPAAPERSVANSAVFGDAAGLARAYEEIAAAYDEIGAQWAVWVPSGDDEATALLEAAGHVLDSEPVGMAVDLRDGIQRPDASALDDWTSSGDLGEVGPINDRAYPFGTDSFTRALSDLSPEGIRAYLARAGGHPAACLVTVDRAPNTEIQMVAALPEARGQGLAGKLLGHALADAAERGIESSTLIATKLGRPVYERLGYRGIGTIQLWERRRRT